MRHDGPKVNAGAGFTAVLVKNQIWLLKNVGWWYLLPIAVALGISTGVSVWHSHHHGVLVVLGGCVYLLIVVLVYWGIY